jgi:hypothetical protein
VTLSLVDQRAVEPLNLAENSKVGQSAQFADGQVPSNTAVWLKAISVPSDMGVFQKYFLARKVRPFPDLRDETGPP